MRLNRSLPVHAEDHIWLAGTVDRLRVSCESLKWTGHVLVGLNVRAGIQAQSHIFLLELDSRS